MAYVALGDGSLAALPRVQTKSVVRSERLILLIGASAIGALLGFIASVSIGRIDMWTILALTAIVIAFALVPAVNTLAEALKRHAWSCATAATLHIGSLLAWPLLIQFDGGIYWLAPATAISSLLLLAACWSGAKRIVYRTSVQGALIAALAAQQGALILLS